MNIINSEEIYEVLKISFSDIYSDQEKSNRVSNIISYDDLMSICNDSTNVENSLELSLIKNVYELYRIKGLFNQSNELNNNSRVLIK